MTDIVVRLRAPAKYTYTLAEGALRREAADEIERLHATLAEIASQCHNLPRSATADKIEKLARGEYDR